MGRGGAESRGGGGSIERGESERFLRRELLSESSSL